MEEAKISLDETTDIFNCNVSGYLSATQVISSVFVAFSTSHSLVVLACAKCFLFQTQGSYITSISSAAIVLVFSDNEFMSTVGLSKVGAAAAPLEVKTFVASHKANSVFIPLQLV
jgi:hypothetical protein